MFGLAGCGPAGPTVLYEDGRVSVVEQAPAKGLRAGDLQLYRRGDDYVLNGSATVIVDHLARTQVQWLQAEQSDGPARSLVVVLKNGTRPADPAALNAVLTALEARLQPTGDTNHYVFLHAPDLTEGLLLSHRRQTTGLTQNAVLYQFDTAGVHLTNDTGVPLRMDQSVVDRYLPDLVGRYGAGIDSVPFSLRVVPYPGVRLVTTPGGGRAAD